MKKQEALKLIKEKIGFIPYREIFEIYSDEDEIPQESIDKECEPIKSPESFLYCSSKIAVEINKVLGEWNPPVRNEK